MPSEKLFTASGLAVAPPTSRRGPGSERLARQNALSCRQVLSRPQKDLCLRKSTTPRQTFDSSSACFVAELYAGALIAPIACIKIDAAIAYRIITGHHFPGQNKVNIAASPLVNLQPSHNTRSLVSYFTKRFCKAIRSAPPCFVHTPGTDRA